MVSMQSAASNASACERRNCIQVVAARVRGGIDPGLPQDLPDRGRGEADPEGEQFPMHPPIAPRRVLPYQAQHQHADRAHASSRTGSAGRWAAPCSPLRRCSGSSRRSASRAHHADQLWDAYSGTRAATVVGSLARPLPLVAAQRHRTVAVFEHHRLDAGGRCAGHTTTHAITALDRAVDRYVYVPHQAGAEVVVLGGGVIERRAPFGDDLEALEIRLLTPLEPGEVTSLQYETRFPGEVATEFRRFAHSQTDNVDIRVTFDPRRLPGAVCWTGWDDYRGGRRMAEEPVRPDAQHSVHRFLRRLESSVVGFRWNW
jgi:hypothetical protein